jgi:hypothetical protein
MKAILGMILVFVLSAGIGAQQGEGTNCGFSFVVEDHTCGDGCQSSTFYVDETSSNYRLNCQMINCTDPLYAFCRATMTLSVNGGSAIASCDNQGQEGCGESFGDHSGLTLYQGTLYRLTVCMTSCPDEPDHPCTHCDDCVARAQVCLSE